MKTVLKDCFPLMIKTTGIKLKIANNPVRTSARTIAAIPEIKLKNEIALMRC